MKIFFDSLLSFFDLLSRHWKVAQLLLHTIISRKGSKRATTAKKIDVVFLKQALLAKANGKKQLDDLELHGPITLRILDGIA